MRDDEVIAAADAAGIAMSLPACSILITDGRHHCYQHGLALRATSQIFRIKLGKADGQGRCQLAFFNDST